MSRRHYANAPTTTLVSAITSSDTVLTVDDASSFPTLFPYTLILDYKQATEEIVDVTAASGNQLTVSRGSDNSTAFAHPSGAVVAHGVSARDADEANLHVNTDSGVHGVTGDLVGTSDTQTLTNKTINQPTISSPTVTTPSVTGGTFDSPDIDTPTIDTPTITDGTMSGTTLTDVIRVKINPDSELDPLVFLGQTDNNLGGFDRSGNLQAANFDAKIWATYTPSIGNTGGASWSGREGRWARIGVRTVVFTVQFTASGAGSGNDFVNFTLPTECSRTIRQSFSGHMEAPHKVLSATTFTSGSGATVDRILAEGGDNLTGSDITADSIITITGMYLED